MSSYIMIKHSIIVDQFIISAEDFKFIVSVNFYNVSYNTLSISISEILSFILKVKLFNLTWN